MFTVSALRFVHFWGRNWCSNKKWPPATFESWWCKQKTLPWKGDWWWATGKNSKSWKMCFFKLPFNLGLMYVLYNEKTNSPSPWVCPRKMDGFLGARLKAMKVKQGPKEFPTNLGSVKKTNKHIQPIRLNIVIWVTSENWNSLTSPLRVFFLGRHIRLDQNFIISFHQPAGKRGHRSNLWTAKKVTLPELPGVYSLEN